MNDDGVFSFAPTHQSVQLGESRLVACGVGGKWQTFEQVFPLDYRHGLYPLWALGPSVVQTLAKVSDTPCTDVRPEDLLLLDTETTGLYIEDGAIVFLVGIGRLSSTGLILRQHLLTDLAYEDAFLEALHRHLGDFKIIMTFNGRAFDTQILGYRFAYHGILYPFGNVPNVDLLTVARRLWRGILPSCCLSNLEATLLQVYRWDDLPGWQIPAAYRDWLRTGDDVVLRNIFRHNAGDILSMVTLGVHISNLLTDPLSHSRFHEEVIKVARLWEHTGEVDRASYLYQWAASSNRLEGQGREALAKLATICAKYGDPRKAFEIGQRLAQIGWPHPKPFLEIAKALRSYDRDAALAQASEALERARRMGLHSYAKRAEALKSRLLQEKDYGSDSSPTGLATRS